MGGMYHFDVMVSQRILYLNGRGIQSLNQELRIGRGKKNKLKQHTLSYMRNTGVNMTHLDFACGQE